MIMKVKSGCETMLSQSTSLIFEGKYDFAILDILGVSLGIRIHKKYPKARPGQQPISTEGYLSYVGINV